jgi:hypothetical protein
MITVGAAFPYLVQSVMILALCFLWVAALLDLRSHMRTGVTSHKVLVLIAISISVLEAPSIGLMVGGMVAPPSGSVSILLG